jgi:hypothetical protein
MYIRNRQRYSLNSRHNLDNVTVEERGTIHTSLSFYMVCCQCFPIYSIPIVQLYNTILQVMRSVILPTVQLMTIYNKMSPQNIRWTALNRLDRCIYKSTLNWLNQIVKHSQEGLKSQNTFSFKLGRLIDT